MMLMHCSQAGETNWAFTNKSNVQLIKKPRIAGLFFGLLKMTAHQRSSQKFVYDDDTINVSMTFGISEYSSSDLSIDELIRRADVALYEGKEKGKD